MEPKFRRAFATGPTLNAFELIERMGSRCTQAHIWFVVFAVAARVAWDLVVRERLDSPEVARQMGIEPDDVEWLLTYADTAYSARR
jgi:hypothetical protein